MIYVIKKKEEDKDGFIIPYPYAYTTDIHLAAAYGNKALQEYKQFLDGCTKRTAEEERKTYHSVQIEIWNNDGSNVVKAEYELEGVWKYIMFSDFESKQAHFYVFDDVIKIAPEKCDQKPRHI